MKEFATYILEIMACSGILLLAYHILLERRTEFRLCRTFLLMAPVISAIIPLINIPIWAAKMVYIQSPAVSNATTAIESVAPADMANVEVYAAEQPFDLLPIAWAIYALGVVVALFLICYQFWAIRRLERQGEIIRNVPLVIRAADDISSFSFFGTIYVGHDSTDDDVESIMIHEYSHIRHSHSAERVAMEFLRALLWWNPFVWIMQRRLMEVHEYEADAEVLKRGCDISTYITTILKSILGYSPDIANGLRDSLTKKRIKMMTKQTPSRYVLLRTLAFVPILAGLLCAFSFTAKATEYIYAQNGAEGTTDKDGRLLEVRVTDTQGTPIKGAVVMYSDSQCVTTDENGRAIIKNGVISELNIAYVGREVKSTSVDDKADRAIVNVVMELVPTYIYGVAVSNYDSSENFSAQYNNEQAAKAIESTSKSLASSNQPLKDGEERFVKVEQTVLYDGGDINKFRDYIQANVKYPADAIREGKHGTVIAEFIVEADASLSNITIKESPYISLSSEVVRAINAAPLKWTPAMQRGEATRMKCYIPIIFSLKKDDTLRRANYMSYGVKANKEEIEKFKRYMQQSLRYPKLAQDKKTVGRIVASFVIDENSLPSNIYIHPPMDDILAAETTRIISNYRGWEIKSDEKVPDGVTLIGGSYVIAIDFVIMDDKGTISAHTRNDINDDKLHEIYGDRYIGAMTVAAYAK